MLNVVALHGRLSRPAVLRLMPSGSSMVTLEVTTRRAGGARAESVPVSWPDAPAVIDQLEAGEEVVVVGHVARRFFRAGGTTQSRTEVVASVVVPATSVKKAGNALRSAARAIEDGVPVPAAKAGRRSGSNGKR